MKKTEPSTVVSQRVADILAERILSGELKPDARIKQDELAAELNISRIPVRDALRILETRGLVSLRPNVGARVTSSTIRDMEISYRVREALEPMLLAESMPHLSDADIEEMRHALAELNLATDAEHFLPLDRQFHWIAFRGHNAPQLMQIVERLWDSTQSYRRAYAKLSLKNGGTVMRTEHEMLFSAIERREVETAQAVLVMHIRRTRVGLANYSYLIGADPVVRTSPY
jgi:DNA-binding GntR family transcriptional regulator